MPPSIIILSCGWHPMRGGQGMEVFNKLTTMIKTLRLLVPLAYISILLLIRRNFILKAVKLNRSLFMRHYLATFLGKNNTTKRGTIVDFGCRNARHVLSDFSSNFRSSMKPFQSRKTLQCQTLPKFVSIIGIWMD